MLNEEIRSRMRETLLSDIKAGHFIQEWGEEQAAGSETLAKLKAEALNNAMSQAEADVIPLVQRAHALHEQD